MKKRALVLVGAFLLAACTAAKDFSSPGLEPIPGSVTYGGQPRTKLTKSPPGSTFPHNFIDQWGQQVDETYMIQPDRSLKIVHREFRPIRFHR
ncbi:MULTISPECIES: hypothetical protein [unclassified Rhizobium]|uniref:hypothetical protein n=1 Tax=unclassified Rhizobium TaxID=2613769 RepID=UPI001785C8C6|nr:MULTISPECIES: hypothetical protein [unclassified Rhizobium]MBD9444288.1 hypothetical protein [Rhizobium sp. RHZ01]MBD9450076.1 hypothetical protein [Rhizobium sp. RHZ02]